MKVFVIGATGYIGSHVAKRLIETGHSVVGFARNEAGAAAVTAYGATPFIGDVAELDPLCAAAADADATIFAPQIPTQPEENRIVSALLKALSGTGKTFVFTSGTGVLGQRTDGEWSEDSFAEDDEFIPAKYIVIRRHTEIVTRVASKDGVRAMVVRPPLIWGNGYHGFIDRFLESIEKTGSACYIGAGRNMYTNVHVDDLAELYRLVIENGRAGALYHAAGGELNNRSIAEYVARQQGVGAKSITMGEAIELWGKFAALVVLGASSRSRSPRSRNELGWTPTRLDLVEQILAGQLNGRK